MGAFGGFLLAIGIVVLIALDIPAKAMTSAGEAVGRAGFTVKRLEVKGIRQMDSRPVYALAMDQKSMAMPLVDVHAIRDRLLQYGWVKDARVSRRLPDTLVIDIVERQPAALWQDRQQLALFDAMGNGPANPAEFWSALGSRLRPSITLCATLAMELFKAEPAALVGPLVGALEREGRVVVDGRFVQQP